jgi:hypothetical protein
MARTTWFDGAVVRWVLQGGDHIVVGDEATLPDVRAAEAAIEPRLPAFDDSPTIRTPESSAPSTSPAVVADQEAPIDAEAETDADWRFDPFDLHERRCA